MPAVTAENQTTKLTRPGSPRTFRVQVARFPVVTQKSASRLGGEENHHGEEHHRRLSV